VVDANVARVLARLSDMRTPVDSSAGKARLRELALRLQPARGGRDFNEALMELGALVCLPRGPRCDACPVRSFCLADDPGSLPVRKARSRTVRISENCAWIFQHGKVLLERQDGPRWRGLWKLPALEGGVSESLGAPLFTGSHSFTHHRVALAVFLRDAPQKPAANQRWWPASRLGEAPMPAPHRRAAERLLSSDG
jgi:A/G-specific adenine glycosylase